MEDAVVEEEDAELGPDQVECVQDLRDDQELGDEDDVVGMQSISVQAHAVVVHGEDEAHDDEVPDLLG